MEPLESFADQLADAARSMQGWANTQLTLEKVVLVATEMIQGCDLVGISVCHKDRIDTPVGSNETLNRIDELQFVLKEGPCFDALHMHEIVRSGDLVNDQRWPTWGPLVAREVGVVSIVSYRLYTTRDTLGAMNLYSAGSDAFDADDINNGHALAAHVGVALAASQNTEHLEEAIASRTVIGRAEGILMERFDLPADQAFGVLRRVSQGRNVKLNRIAEELVRTGETPR
ncbi:ANTAR domain protein [Nocardioides dokdonensis FR1436]|uniref:ANTAR domain protein n=1 Tax=Nocardioides dokdonensis FR1436 TaxID=1300347 RepID=A0A1A9GEB9_9ACTN|nr:GAF and ANTAR domain-containing protein [Nocardioides dokdonensis]ANH36669.1 ANTAR domain protein [Nocardioides dokdonensis FR1436]